MKHTYHIPTEQFGFVEVELDKGEEMTPEVIEDAVAGYQSLSGAYKGGEGIPEKGFHDFLDTYLSTNTGDVEVYALMSKEQMKVVQEIKKSLKRIDYKISKA